MTNEQLVELLSSNEFNLNDYEPLETDTTQQAADKLAFLQQMADLKETELFKSLPQEIMCMVDCIINVYLPCGGTPPCWLLLQTCVNSCSPS